MGWVSTAIAPGRELDAPYEDIRKHGARSGGVHDCTAAINRALSISSRVFIPSGTYLYTTLSISEGKSIFGAGIGSSVLIGGMIAFSGNNVSIEKLSVLTTSSTAIEVSSHSVSTLDTISVDFDASVTSNWIGFNAYLCNDITVKGCVFKKGGLQFSGAERYMVSGNRFDGEYVNDNELIHASAKSFGQIVNNLFYRMLNDGVDIYSSGRGCVISGNRFVGCQSAQAIECKVTMTDTPSNSSGETLGFVESTVISNNYFTNFVSLTTGERCAIYAEYIDNRAVNAFSVAEPVRGMVISGNVMENFSVADPSPVIASYNGIVFSGNNSVISGNVIRNMYSHSTAKMRGMKIAFGAGVTCYGLNVSNNIISGVEGSTSIAIEHKNLKDSVFSGNVIRHDDVTSLSTKYGIRITTESTVERCTYIGNVFACNVAASQGLSISGTTGTFSRCTVSGNQFKDCGISLPNAEFLCFTANQCDFVTNSQVLALGNSGTTRKGNRICNNDFIASDDYIVVLIDQSGYIVSNNVFTDANRPVLLTGVSQNGIISENISYSQVQASPIITYSGVSAPDQATISDTGNKII